MEMIKVTFLLPAALVKATKLYAVHQDLTLQTIMRQALEAYLKGSRR